MGKTLVEDWDVWDAVYDTSDGFEFTIATNEDYGIEVKCEPVSIGAYIRVFVDGVNKYEELVRDEQNCYQAVRRVYDKYIDASVFEVLKTLGYTDGEDDDSWSYEDDEDEDDSPICYEDELIKTREEELDALFHDLYIEILGDSDSYPTEKEAEMLADVKEHMLRYMHEKHGVPIYRPMKLEDEEGEEFFEEYPYPCLIFDEDEQEDTEKTHAKA